MGLKLNLGSGNIKMLDFISVDINPDIADVVWDLRKTPYPFEDRSCEYICAHHLVEHLYAHEHMTFMSECWRILDNNGYLELIFPTWDSEYAWIDPTHVRGIHPKQYEYFTKVHGFEYTDKFWNIHASGPEENNPLFWIVLLSPDKDLK